MGDTKRKKIGAKLRFEVFKRDSFTCQYCGRKAPDVLLHIEHIIPVAEGGTNDILNLITSCSDCNYGKGKILLSDNSVIVKQQRQLELLNERRMQLELLLQWREELKNEIEVQTRMAGETLMKNATVFGEPSSGEIPEEVSKYLRKLISEFGLIMVLDSIDIAKEQYDNEATICLDRLGGICYNRTKAKETGVKFYGNKKSS